MAAFKDKKNGSWYVQFRYKNRVRHEGRRITLTYMIVEAVVE